MNNMSEEEIIKNIKEMIQWSDRSTYKMALQGLLDLYNKEKEKNNILVQEKEYLNCIIESDKDNFINKNKIKEKIEELIKEMEEKRENCSDFTLVIEHALDTNRIIEVLKELLKGE